MKYTFLCASLLLIFNYAGSQVPVILNNNDRTVSGSAGFLLDTSGHMDVAHCLQAYRMNKFRLADQKSFQPEYNVYWLHFILQNGTGFDKEWVADFQGWSYVDAYIIGRNGKIDSSHKTGHLVPYRKRDYPVANKAYLLFPVKADATLECFVRLQSALNIEMVPTDLSFRVTARSVTDAENSWNGKVIYTFLAIFFIMFVYNLFIYLSIRLKSYAYYLTLLLLMFYATADNSGYIIELFGKIDSFPVWMAYFERFSSILLPLSTLLFATQFLQVRSRYPAWNKVINTIILLTIITGIIMYIDAPMGMMLLIVPTAAIFICTITLAIKSTKDRFPSAPYFLVGYGAFIVSVFPIPLAYYHIIPANIWTLSYSLSIGSTIEIVSFSFALADTINVLRHENYENQKKQQIFLQQQENMQIRFQQELLKTQLEIQEQTLHNISQEIHDNIGQMLSLIKVNIDRLWIDSCAAANDKLAETRNLVIKVINDIRDLSKSLNTDFIHRIGLSGAIEQQVNLLKKTGQYTIRLSTNGEVADFDAQRELLIFRIVQELLNNILKHSEATKIDVSIDYQKGKLVIVVEDNGKGFDILRAQSANDSLGILNMKNRIKMINGFIDFNSQPQKGTAVTIEVPQ